MAPQNYELSGPIRAPSSIKLLRFFPSLHFVLWGNAWRCGRTNQAGECATAAGSTAGNSSEPSPWEKDVPMARLHRRVRGPGVVFFWLRPRCRTVFSLFPLLFFGAAVIDEQRPRRQHPDRWRNERNPAAGNKAIFAHENDTFSSKNTQSFGARRAKYLHGLQNVC